MTAKEYLQQVRVIDCLIREKKEQIESINDMLRVHGISYDKIPNDCHETDQTEKLIILKIELEKELKKSMIDLLNRKREIMNMVDRLDKPEEIQIIYSRYFKYKKWDEIAEQMGYEERQIYRIHGYALLKLSALLKMSANVGT